ncbi:hypothetical protein FRB99_001320 [Tulasnella sp. 403]|nr:hypothetical protein FRB99_001320 [Tulasnella sp. 403]
MGVGSSKVEYNVTTHSVKSAPIPAVRKTEKYGVDDPYYPIPPPIQRTQSAKKSSQPRSREKQEKRAHRAYASEGGGPFYYGSLPVTIREQQQAVPLKNPVPPPPKDLIATYPSKADFSRVHYRNPAPFVPISNEELKRSKTTKKGKDKNLPEENRVVLHRADPSPSSSSHSSASTSNPPPQVFPTTWGTQQPLQPTQNIHDPMAPDGIAKSVAKRLFCSLRVPFSSSAPQTHDDAPAVIAPRNLTHRAPSDPPPISQPFMLAPRVPQPPTPPPFYFYYPREAGYGFTTFSPHKILYKDRLYPTAEHLYQAMKFLPSKGKGGDLDLAEQIRTCSDHPAQAVLEGRLLNKQARLDWKEMRVPWMEEILYMKFSQHPDLRHELVSTAPADLVFASPADPFWGIGQDHRGRNELGNALVRVRNRILHDMGK